MLIYRVSTISIIGVVYAHHCLLLTAIVLRQSSVLALWLTIEPTRKVSSPRRDVQNSIRDLRL